MSFDFRRQTAPHGQCRRDREDLGHAASTATPSPLRGHQTEVEAASFDPAGRWVVTAGLDQTARVWDAQTGQEIERLHHPAGAQGGDVRRGPPTTSVTLAGDFRARVFGCETCVPLDGLVRLARSRLVPGAG